MLSSMNASSMMDSQPHSSSMPMNALGIDLGIKTSMPSLLSHTASSIGSSQGASSNPVNQQTPEEELQSRLFFGDLKSSSMENILERLLFGNHLVTSMMNKDYRLIPSHRLENLMQQLSLSEDDVIQEIKIFFQSLQQTPRPDFLTPR